MEKLHARLQKGRLTDVVKAQRALGKLLERAARVQRFYRVDLKDAADLRAGLTWQRKDEVRDEEDPLLGGYVLRTDRSQLSQERLWELYILLSRAEDGLFFLSPEGRTGVESMHNQSIHL